MHLPTVDRCTNARPASWSGAELRNDGATQMSLQLAFSAWAMREVPLERQIDIVRRAGYVGICLVSDPAFASLDPATTSVAERRRVRALLDSADLALTAVAGHANPLEPDPTARSANLDRIRAGLDLAADLAGPDGPPPLGTVGYGN